MDGTRETRPEARAHAARAEPRGGVAPLRRQPGSRSAGTRHDGTERAAEAHSARDGLDFTFVGDELRYERASGISYRE